MDVSKPTNDLSSLAGPVGQDDYIPYTEDTPVTFDPLADNGLGVDSDPDGDPIFAQGMGSIVPSNGAAILNGDGTITYTPNAGYTGSDYLSYYLEDIPAAGPSTVVEVGVTIYYEGSFDNCVIGFDPLQWTNFGPNDDASLGPLALPFTFSLYGTNYTDVYLNNNGNVSFDNPYWWYTSTGFPITTPMVAPFWGDVDTRDWLANGYQGEVWYLITPTAFYVTWLNVGPYWAGDPLHDGLEDTFTLVMTDGTDPALAPGNNVGFFYGDMQWTTGSASGGTAGFGGSPATVGINAGDGINYVQMGLFDSDTNDYDGPGGNNDGVNWLDDQCLEFDVSSITNFPPVATGFPTNNEMNVCLGGTENISVGFTGPEFGETVSVAVNDGGWTGVSVDSNTPGNPSTTDLTFTGDALGTHVITFTATDDNGAPETTIINLTVNVVECGCGSAPAITCPTDISINSASGACDGAVTVPQLTYTNNCLGTSAIEYDGGNDYLSIPDVIPDGAFSIEFWFKPPSSTWSGALYDMSEDNPGAGGNQKFFYIEASDSEITWEFEDSGDLDIANEFIPYDFSTVQWYHIAATGAFNSSGPHELYVNGVLVSSVNTSAASKPSTYNTPRLGNYGSAHKIDQNAFGGQMDNFRIFDKQLSATEVNEVMCADISSVVNNVLINYDFEDGAGSSTATDASIYGNDGTLTNMDNVNAWVNTDLESSCTTITNDYNGTDDASDTYPIGTTTVTWTVDVSGMSSTCTHDITVVPSITCPADITQNNDAGSCDAVVAVPQINFLGGGGSSCTTIDSNDFEAGWGIWNDGGSDARRSNADAAYASSGSYCIRLRDNTSTSVMTTDNMDLSSYSDIDVSFGYYARSMDSNNEDFWLQISTNGGGSYTTVEEWNLNDEFVNDQFYTDVVNITGPFTANTRLRFRCDASSNNDYVYIDDVLIENCTSACGVTSIVNDYNGTDDASGTYPVGSTTVNWTATYSTGDTATCSHVVTVNDTEVPTASCQDITVNLDAAGQATIVAGDVDGGSTDNCGISGLSLDQLTFDCSDLSPSLTVPSTDGYFVHISAYPTSVNPATMSCAWGYNYTVTMAYNVTFSGVNIPANLYTLQGTTTCSPGGSFFNLPNSGGSGSVNTANNWTANTDCATVTPASLGCTSTDITIEGPGIPITTLPLPSSTAPVILTVTDNSGNTSTCTSNVTVLDNINPTISCPSNVTVNSDAGLCTASGVSLGSPTTSDNCSVASTTNDAPATFPLGNTTVTWTVTDGSGNTATCTQTVTVNDTEDPTISCPSNVTVSADAGLCTASGVSLGSATTNDNCSVASTTNDAPAVFPLGTTTVTWTVTDGSGNTATCAQTVTVNDTENPTISCPSNVTVSADAGICTASGVSLGSATTNDNCSVTSTTNDAPAVFPLGMTTVTWTVTDASGNTATCTQTVTVNDTQNPTISCPSDITISADAGNCNASSVSLGSATTADNCSVASVTNDAPAIFPAGTTTVTWTVTDGSGNTATCTQTVTVNDTENPIITCPADITLNEYAGTCDGFNSVSIGSPIVTDNCTIASITNDAPATFSIGTTTVTWTVTDGSGNTASCSQDIIVEELDDVAPSISCPPGITIDLGN